jgi:hypothetical protein
MPRLRLAVVPFVLLMSVGCFEGQRTFKVNADGSGAIVDTTKLGAQAQGMLQGLEGMEQGSPAEKKAKKTAKFLEKAKAMGEGVTFISSEPGKDGLEVTTYAFKDITKVKASAMPAPNESTSSKDEPAVFRLARNAAGNMVLTISTPKGKSSSAAAETPAKKSAAEITQQITMMKAMMAGLKVRSLVEVNGSLVKATGGQATGSVVTLMELDFDALDAAALQKLAESESDGPPTPAMLKGIKGIKVSEPEVTIEFKAVK